MTDKWKNRIGMIATSFLTSSVVMCFTALILMWMLNKQINRKSREISKEEIQIYHEEIWKVKFSQDSIQHDSILKILNRTYDKLK